MSANNRRNSLAAVPGAAGHWRIDTLGFLLEVVRIQYNCRIRLLSGCLRLTWLIRHDLPDFTVNARNRHQLYFRFDPPHDIAPLAEDQDWKLKKPAREWTAEDKAALRQGLLNLQTKVHAHEYRSTWYYLAHYELHDRYSPKEVESMVKQMNREFERYTGGVGME